MPADQIQPLEFKDPRRSRLNEQLESLGRGPAALFRDACRLFDGQIEAETAAHIAGHLQRELLSSVEDVLLPFGYEEPRAGDDPKVVKAILRSVGLSSEASTARLRKTLPKYLKPQGGSAPSKVRIIADSLGLPYDHEIVDLARGLKLHTIAHRSGLKGAPPLRERGSHLRFSA
jgi:hypothetical protein